MILTGDKKHWLFGRCNFCTTKLHTSSFFQASSTVDSLGRLMSVWLVYDRAFFRRFRSGSFAACKRGENEVLQKFKKNGYYFINISVHNLHGPMMSRESELYFDISEHQWPIVYDDKYNVSFLGLEKLHPFASKKWGHVIQRLKDAGLITDENLVRPLEAQKNDLLVVHTKKYLKSLKWSVKVAVIAEIPIMACIPNALVQAAYLKPMRLQTGGSILAGKLALERGWAINVGGGFHHCSGARGGGFCPYADVSLLLMFLLQHRLVKQAMIVDLDAHQGNGHERDFMGVPEVYIMDMYNKRIYPRDREAKQAIRRKVELKHHVEDLEYMLKLRNNLKAALNEFKPDILVYNAGTDILDADPLGGLRISEQGIIKRDEFVFEICKENHIPIVMLTSGGYLAKTARIIADSIMNLHNKGLIGGYNTSTI